MRGYCRDKFTGVAERRGMNAYLVATPALAAEPVGRASPTVEDLKDEINQLTAEVEELKKGDSPFTVNGYYRLQATSESLDTTDDNSAAFVDQRLRAKITGDLNDNVSLVWYGEVDSPWGETGSCQGDNCGKLSADGVGVETKNAYAELKVPNSDCVGSRVIDHPLGK